MYNIALCDDEPAFLREAALLVEQIMAAHGLGYRLQCFDTPQALLAATDGDPAAFDLFLLDILIGRENGVQLANRLRQEGSEASIIFITSSPDFMQAGYSAEASGYLMKPVAREQLEPVLLRAYNRNQRGVILLDTTSLSVSFRLADIQYIEIFNRTLAIHTTAGKTELTMSLREIMEKLPHDRFVQCHRSYLVSVPAILSIRRYEIELRSHEKIPVSRNCYKSVQDALLVWAARM